jgi:hypothetical protein
MKFVDNMSTLRLLLGGPWILLHIFYSRRCLVALIAQSRILMLLFLLQLELIVRWLLISLQVEDLVLPIKRLVNLDYPSPARLRGFDERISIVPCSPSILTLIPVYNFSISPAEIPTMVESPYSRANSNEQLS